MFIDKLKFLALLIPSMCCMANDLSISDMVYLTGGVCVDETFAITQAVAKQSDFVIFAFSDECRVLGVDKSNLDTPPSSFVCRTGGKSLLSGATYKMIKKSIIKNHDGTQVDTRVYLYECSKGCGNAPKRIQYSVADCG